MKLFTEILTGLQIIEKFDPDTGIYAEHEQIWCGDATKASDEQKKQLEALNWFIDDTDSFSHWT